MKPKCYGKPEYFSIGKCFGSKCQHWMSCMYDLPQPTFIVYSGDLLQTEEECHKVIEKKLSELLNGVPK